MPQTADFILQRLTAWGIHRIYAYPGDGINSLLGAFDRAGGDPEFIRPRREEMGAFMATAHAKFTGDHHRRRHRRELVVAAPQDAQGHVGHPRRRAHREYVAARSQRAEWRPVRHFTTLVTVHRMNRYRDARAYFSPEFDIKEAQMALRETVRRIDHDLATLGEQLRTTSLTPVQIIALHDQIDALLDQRQRVAPCQGAHRRGRGRRRS